MPEHPLTLLEVAERYRFSERRLRAIIRKHSLPVLRDGHWIGFDATAISALDEALRCPSKSSAAKTGPAFSRYRGELPGSAADAARKATALLSPAKKPPRLDKGAGGGMSARRRDEL